MGDGGERRHVQVPRRAAAARRPLKTPHHRALELPEGHSARATRAAAGSTAATPGCSASRSYSRARRSAVPKRVVLDPNALSPDGSIALSGFVPSPDGRHFAYGQSEGGSDWSTYYVRELGTGKQLPDAIRWVKFSSLSWTKDGKGFFYGRYPEPPPARRSRRRVRDKKIYYHALGTPQSADRLIYERPDEPMLFIDADSTRPAAICSSSPTRARATRTSCS